MPSAGERVNRTDKAPVLMKLMFKRRDNEYIGNSLGSWRVVSTLEMEGAE